MECVLSAMAGLLVGVFAGVAILAVVAINRGEDEV
jgi:hypothetical protein